MEQNMNIKLLSNAPCGEDTFEGHAHQRIAEQVARIIRNDSNRHIIGIEGGWGSGKSNLISLVNCELNGKEVVNKDYDHKSCDFPFFIYDAWGHQADFQRRSILEELTNDLTNEKKIFEGKKWKDKLEELLAKRRKTRTKEVPSLGIGVIVSVLMTILTPLVIFLVGLIPDSYWLLKLILSILPYIGAIYFVIQKRKKSLRDNGQECSLANILSELVLIYKDKIKENETYTTISEKEPSSAEFKKWMEDVDSDLNPLNKTLIIVFDNMDRLPSQKVELLWSSIHSFFSDKTYEHIKVIIPFDRQHINLVFKKEDNEDISYGHDFINKTFDIVFRVPPPIMSGWQQYMIEKWKEAFGENTEPSLSVIQIFEALNKKKTPRNIIAFINEMATVKMTINDDIPECYIALFVFGKEELDKDPLGQLLSPKYMGDVEFEYGSDRNTIKYLSALYYLLPADDAMDIVFTKEATEALNCGDSDKLIKMMEHIDLSTILSKAILKVNNVENTTKSLAGLDSFMGFENYGDMPDWLIAIWGDLLCKYQSVNGKWNEIKDFHVALFKHTFNSQLAENLITGYLSIDEDKWNPEMFVRNVKELKEDNDLIDIELEKRKRKVSPKLFLDLLKYTKDEYEDYGITFDKSEVDTYLSALEKNEIVSLKVIPYITLEKDTEWLDYPNKIKSLIRDNNLSDIDELSALFTRLKEVEDKPIDFEQFFSDDKIYNCWNKLHDSSNIFKYDILSMRLSRGNNYPSQYRSPFRNIIDDPDENDIERLTKVIEYYKCYGGWLVDCNVYKDFPIVVEVVKKLTVAPVRAQRATIMSCLEKFDVIAKNYDLDEKALANRLCAWSEWIDFKNTTINQIPRNLIKVCMETNNNMSNIILNECINYYASLSQEEWKEHIITQDETFWLWKLYHPKKYQANFDALKEILKEQAIDINANLSSKDILLEWIDICLEVGHHMKGLFNEIFNILKKDSVVTKDKLLFFGPLILKYTDINSKQDFIERLIPSEMIDDEVINFIAINIEKLKECVILDEFKEKVIHLGQTSLKNNNEVKSICNIFHIELGGNENEKK